VNRATSSTVALATPGEDAFWPAAAIGGPGARAVVA
jgi:hypothetical protein